jgi:hypothetical protein
MSAVVSLWARLFHSRARHDQGDSEIVKAFNAKMEADPDRMMRLAAANARRIAGKSCL